MTERPRVVVLRGHHANIGELRPWELLLDRFEIEVVTTARADQQLDGLQVPWTTARTRRDRLPRGRLGTLSTQLIGDAYLDTEALVRGAAIVHTAELGPWFAAQPARLRQSHGFRLVTTVWETIPFRSTFRTARAASNRLALLAETDLFLPTTERARRCLLLEGAAPERIQVVEPGIDVERFAGGSAPAGEGHLVVSPGRLVWEKGHYDVIRALATSGGDARLLIVGCRPRAEQVAALRRRSGPGGPGRDPVRSLRRDAGRLRPRVVRRSRQPADPDVGGAVRVGAGRGARRRRVCHGELLGGDPRGSSWLGRSALHAGRLARARAPARGRPARSAAGCSELRIRSASSSGTPPVRRPTGLRPPTSGCSTS